jgi:hypothetical protein
LRSQLYVWHRRRNFGIDLIRSRESWRAMIAIPDWFQRAVHRSHSAPDPVCSGPRHSLEAVQSTSKMSRSFRRRFWEIRLRGPWTLADVISEVSAPSVWRSLFGPVDFGELKSQEVDSANLQRNPAVQTGPRPSGSGQTRKRPFQMTGKLATSGRLSYQPVAYDFSYSRSVYLPLNKSWTP